MAKRMSPWRRFRRALAIRRRICGPTVAARPSTDAPSPPSMEMRDGTNRRLETFSDILRPIRPGKLLDLGTGHGAFAVIAKDLGWEVTAVDARTVRMPMTAGIEWVHADVREYDVSGFDCIAVLGLLYHLEYSDVRTLLQRCAGTPTILDTHTASKVNQVEDGYEGQTFREIQDYAPEGLADTPTAAWGNQLSWWPTRQALVRLLQDVGFRTILVLDPPTMPDRTFYLCL